MTFIVGGIDTEVAESAREEIGSGRLDGRSVVLDEPGAPCRHCLAPGAVGERMLLFTYQPFRGHSPYAVPSPIFLHADACAPYATPERIPNVARPGLRAVRSYDGAHDLVDGDVAPGSEIEGLIDRLLADPRAEYAHVHSATAGCFTFRVDRTDIRVDR